MSKSKTPLTDAVQEAFNKRDGMCVNDIIEAYEHARVLEMVVAKLRDRCNRLKRQREWLRIQQQATSPNPLPTEDTEHPEKPATTKHTKHTKGKP